MLEEGAVVSKVSGFDNVIDTASQWNNLNQYHATVNDAKALFQKNSFKVLFDVRQDATGVPDATPDYVTMADADDKELSLFTGITGRRCYPQSNLALKHRTDRGDEPDSFAHEQCLAIRQGERQLLISGCAHNGILNILDRYRELYYGEPDIATSGFHMMKKSDYTKEEEQVISDTARELAGYHTVFYTGHCTGEAVNSTIFVEKPGCLLIGLGLAVMP